MTCISARLARRVVTGAHARTQGASLAACLLAALTAAACAAESAEAPDVTLAEAPTMNAVYSQVLEPRCTFSSCHSAPTVAAKLDLTREGMCKALVNTSSCLFPRRMLVVPSDPESSFLMHKLTGSALTEQPDGNCSSASNLPMPFGGTTLPADEIALVRAWIAAGAPCDSGQPGPTPTPTGPALASLAADPALPLAGDIVTFTVTLDRPAPEGGQAVALQTDDRALSAPIEVSVPPGKTVVRFEAYAHRPSSLFTLVARAGASSKSLELRVGGLEVAEALADAGQGNHSQWVKLRNRSSVPLDLTGFRLQVGQTSYGLIAVPLSGILEPNSCLVLGNVNGPAPSGDAVTFQQVDFTPDLPTTGTQAAGYALFDGEAAPTGAPPFDTMLVGATNQAQLLGVDGHAATPTCATPPAGSSARRTAATTCVSSVPQITQCL
jgi:hypothetical protein